MYKLNRDLITCEVPAISYYKYNHEKLFILSVTALFAISCKKDDDDKLGDAHNVLGSFPTLTDKRLRELYTPLWDLNIAVWSDEVVAKGENFAQRFSCN